MNTNNIPLENVADYVKTHPPKEFNPKPNYNEDGQFITWFWKNEPYYAESVNSNEGVSVGSLYRSEETGEIIGCCIFIDGNDMQHGQLPFDLYFNLYGRFNRKVK